MRNSSWVVAGLILQVNLVECGHSGHRLSRWNKLIAGTLNRTRPFAEQGPALWDFWESVLTNEGDVDRLEMTLLEMVLYVLPREDEVAKLAAQRFAKLVESKWRKVYELSQQHWQREVSFARRMAQQPGKQYSHDSPVHIAMIASVGNPPFGRKALATIRSALFFARQRLLQFHLVVDEAGEKDLRRSISTLDPWLRARATFRFIQAKSLWHVWKKIRSVVPESCLNFTSIYGSPGWLRMFPHDVLKGSSARIVIWPDAGDFIFLGDPADIVFTHMKFRKGQVAAAPLPHVLELQMFDLIAMRRSNWTAVVKKLVREGMAQWDKFCYLGEGEAFLRITRQDETKYLFGLPWETMASTWAHVPYGQIPGDGLVDIWAHPGKTIAEIYKNHTLNNAFVFSQVWRARLDPGVENFASLRIHCPSFLQEYAYRALEMINSNIDHLQVARKMHDIALSSQEQGIIIFGQNSRCNDGVHGVHFVRAFHYVPWAHRFMNFWAGCEAWSLARQSKDDSSRDLRV